MTLKSHPHLPSLRHQSEAEAAASKDELEQLKDGIHQHQEMLEDVRQFRHDVQEETPPPTGTRRESAAKSPEPGATGASTSSTSRRRLPPRLPSARKLCHQAQTERTLMQSTATRRRPPSPEPTGEAETSPPNVVAKPRIEPKAPPSEPTRSAPTKTRRRPPRARIVKSADLGIKVRWWNILPVLALCAVPVAGMGWVSLEYLKSGLVLSDLETAVSNRQPNRQQVSAALAHVPKSALFRFDARRDYLVAQGLAITGLETDEAVRTNLIRAIERRPANPWYRLSRLRFLEATEAPAKDVERAWSELLKRPSPQPLYLRTVADYWLNAGNTEQALSYYGRFLKAQPEETAQVLAAVTKKGVPLEDSLRVVPENGEGVLKAVQFLQTHDGTGWRNRALAWADRLRIDDQTSATDAAALAELYHLLALDDRAAESLRRALSRQPGRYDWKLRLARWLYAERAFAESQQLAAQIVSARPGSELAKKAQILREQIDLATTGSRPAAN